MATETRENFAAYRVTSKSGRIADFLTLPFALKALEAALDHEGLATIERRKFEKEGDLK